MYLPASHTNRPESLAAYWAPRLERRTYSAFTLDEILLTDYGLMVDYRGYDGKAARIHFRFSSSGKILRTSCRLLAGYVAQSSSR
jgi:hypothetical protein